jgi:hypothetical protein
MIRAHLFPASISGEAVIGSDERNLNSAWISEPGNPSKWCSGLPKSRT